MHASIVADGPLAERVDGLRTVLEQAAARGAAQRDEPAQLVRIAAATKYLDAVHIPALVAAGIDILAESRLEVLRTKQDALTDLPASVAWHWIGRLQSRQAPEIAQRTHSIHTLASASAAMRLARAREEMVAGSGSAAGDWPQILVQVNVDGDPTKDGIPAADLDRFLSDLPETLRVDGAMTMPAFADDPELSRPAFRALRELTASLRAQLGDRHPLRELSMGTSQDHVVAAEEGATIVRLGSVLFGDLARR